jgi:hypothetical protein
MVGGDQPRIDPETSADDGEVMKASLEFDAAHFHDPEATPLRAIVDRQLFEKNDAIGDARFGRSESRAPPRTDRAVGLRVLGRASRVISRARCAGGSRRT